MDYGDILQSASVLIAAVSVFFAVRTYKNSRITQQITALRSALGDSRRKVDFISSLLSEAGACQVGFSVARQLRLAFGSDLSPDALADLIGNKEHMDIVVSAIHEGFSQTSISEDLDDAEDKFAAVDVHLKTLAPTTSFIVASGVELMMTAIRSTYSTRHLMQIFSEGNNLELTRKNIRSKPNIDLAYADLADSISLPPVEMMKAKSKEAFNQARKLHDAPVDKLMSMTDEELREFFSRDKRIKFKASESDSIESILRTASQALDRTSELFESTERDAMIRSAAQLEVSLLKSS